MKKNNMLRIASVLLVAVLLSTCAISGAFAKYITVSDPNADSARVAKWGVTITPTSTAFGTKYDGAVTADAASATVVSSTTDKVVAPGTNGTVSTLTISGTPEVDVTVDYKATLTLTGWEIDSKEYCPIVFDIDGNKIKIDGTTITDIAGLKAAVEAAINGSTQTFEAGEDLSAATAASISWAWDIGSSNEAGDDTNVKDTALGYAAAGYEWDAVNNAWVQDTDDSVVVPTISLKIKATVAQAN